MQTLYTENNMNPRQYKGSHEKEKQTIWYDKLVLNNLLQLEFNQSNLWSDLVSELSEPRGYYSTAAPSLPISNIPKLVTNQGSTILSVCEHGADRITLTVSNWHSRPIKLQRPGWWWAMEVVLGSGAEVWARPLHPSYRPWDIIIMIMMTGGPPFHGWPPSACLLLERGFSRPLLGCTLGPSLGSWGLCVGHVAREIVIGYDRISIFLIWETKGVIIIVHGRKILEWGRIMRGAECSRRWSYVFLSLMIGVDSCGRSRVFICRIAALPNALSVSSWFSHIHFHDLDVLLQYLVNHLQYYYEVINLF